MEQPHNLVGELPDSQALRVAGRICAILWNEIRATSHVILRSSFAAITLDADWSILLAVRPRWYHE
jgi:hypothetical protein